MVVMDVALHLSSNHGVRPRRRSSKGSTPPIWFALDHSHGQGVG
jgi:hypothetical protein